jgi:FkbM family methyltransferase
MMEKSTLRPVAFVLIAANHGTMLVNRHDYQLVGKSGFGIGYQLLQTSSFEQPEVDLSLQLLNSRRKNYGDGVIALDCGANIGTHSVEWAKSMHDWGQVIAIEAQERIFYALAGNITINNCFNARAIWAAVGAANGVIGVPAPDYLSPSSFGSLEIRSKPSTEFIGQTVDYSETKLRQTQMITIDALDLARVDLIKMDIEGMELEGLAGAEETIRRTHPQLMIEKIKCDERELLDFCHRHGYRTYPFGFNFLAIHETDPASSKIQIK